MEYQMSYIFKETFEILKPINLQWKWSKYEKTRY